MRVIWILFVIVSPLHAEPGLQSQASIVAAIAAKVEAESRQRGLDYDAEVLPLDPRLRLADCGPALEVFLPQGFREGGAYQTVGVRCVGAQPWTIYAKVKLAVYREVVVLRNALRRGSVIGPDDIALERRNLSLLIGDYLTTPAQAIGKPLLRGLPAGQVLSPAHLTLPKTIRRGDKITIHAAGGGFDIAMSGEALADGEKGERIRVRNEQSGRVVVGTVVGPGVVVVDQ